MSPNVAIVSFAADAYLKQAPLPKSMFPARVVLRCLLISSMTSYRRGGFLILPARSGNWGIALVIPGLFILALNCLWTGLLMACSARVFSRLSTHRHHVMSGRVFHHAGSGYHKSPARMHHLLTFNPSVFLRWVRIH